jgi:hypothetical protein
VRYLQVCHSSPVALTNLIRGFGKRLQVLHVSTLAIFVYFGKRIINSDETYGIHPLTPTYRID